MNRTVTNTRTTTLEYDEDGRLTKEVVVTVEEETRDDLPVATD